MCFTKDPDELERDQRRAANMIDILEMNVWKKEWIYNAAMTDGNMGPDCLLSKQSYKEEQHHY